MSFAQAAKDIETRFSSNWGSTTRWTVDGDISFKPPTSGSWVRLNIADGDSLQVSLGNNPRFRHYGLIVAQVFVRGDLGARAARTHADTIASYYRNVNFGSPSIYCRAPRLINVGEHDGWYQMNVQIPYYWDQDY